MCYTGTPAARGDEPDPNHQYDLVMQLPNQYLRRVALDAQGLTRSAPFGRGLPGASRALEKLGYVQIDTISVVSRAHHHTLFNRVPGYRPEHLNRLITNRDAFEYWFHAAAYLPMRDYRYALPRMQKFRRGEMRWLRSRDTKLMREVLDRVRIDGPLRARDFEDPEHVHGGWWDWKPAKRALEQLFMQGDLMVTSREGFQKVYDLPERVLPAGVDTSEPSEADYAAHLIDVTLGAHGFAAQKAFTYGRRGQSLRTAVTQCLKQRTADGELTTVTCESGVTFYALPSVLDASPRKPPTRVRLLSPFDNAIIQRDRNPLIHDYDYQLECYVTDAKRQFGYFCLPILFGDSFVGRADCKANRQRGVFEIRHLHIEKPIAERERFLAAFRTAVENFAAFNHCSEVAVSRTSPGDWHTPVNQSFG